MPDKITLSMKRFISLVLISLVILSCAQTARVPISKIVGSNTIRTKIVLLPNPQVEEAYQKLAVREYENALTKQPVSRAIKTAFGGEKVDLVLLVRKEVQKIDSFDPQTIKGIGEESEVNTVIVLEPRRVDFREGSVTRRDEFCVTRSAEVEISVKMADTEKGELVFAGVYRGDARAKQCSKGVRRTDKLPSKERLIIKAVKKSAVKFSDELWSNL